jgi:hypothetical protein
MTDRKIRLYMAACCRLESASFLDPAITNAVETAERCADDADVEAAICELSKQCVTSSLKPAGELGRVITSIWRLALEMPSPPDIDDGETYSSVHGAVAHAALLCLRDLPLVVLSGGSGDAAEYCSHAIEQAALVRLGVNKGDFQTSHVQRQTQLANILRDIVGNPFRPVQFDTPWRTANVVDLARTIYEEKTFERLPILADSLMDAGCADEQVLEHCRSDGPHVRGCWVVDLILSKQ